MGKVARLAWSHGKAGGAPMHKVHRPIAKAHAGLADRLFIYGCTAAYLALVGSVIVALKLYVG